MVAATSRLSMASYAPPEEALPFVSPKLVTAFSPYTAIHHESGDFEFFTAELRELVGFFSDVKNLRVVIGGGVDRVWIAFTAEVK